MSKRSQAAGGNWHVKKHIEHNTAAVAEAGPRRRSCCLCHAVHLLGLLTGHWVYKEKRLTGEKWAPTAGGQKVPGLEGWVTWHGWSLTQVVSGEGNYHRPDPSLNATSKRSCLTIPTKTTVISYGLTLFCFFFWDIWHSLKLNLNYWVFCLHSPQPERKSLIRARPLSSSSCLQHLEPSRCSRNKSFKMTRWGLPWWSTG